ncbi:hypothetical protein [Phyllobacterium zundukense]|uniref:Uncharacterized protein n=1 Tax=Phyllobacterium zundukense TaxID=1867719 RepID=A0A2N9W2Z6_9HYPH|nr:hypothetical protein [Phyllobacterium zundukense]ATU94102.1 hypothetical protein BLM14_20175 [Phyllobacterium zundukense]PIO46114.1 hypothetical protein B5P45_04095 [Phyllobacterium zundukense]
MKFLDTLTGGYGTLIAYGPAAALVVGAFGYTYHLGGKHTEATWTAKYSTLVANYAAAALAEGTRQANANADAKAREAVVIATIDAQSTALQELHRKLKDEASRDPTASDDCLNATARLRVNQVR